MKSGLLGVLLVVVIVVGAFLYITGQQDCDAKHGVLVRGAVGYSCVAAP